MARQYEPNPKHKPGPLQHGTLCPEDLTRADAQRLLEEAVPDPTSQGTGSLWIYDQGWVFCARATDAQRDVWHGYPVPGCDVPKEVMQLFKEKGWVDRRAARAVREQLSIPDAWPAEEP
jgi:hypothetical protein